MVALVDLDRIKDEPRSIHAGLSADFSLLRRRAAGMLTRNLLDYIIAVDYHPSVDSGLLTTAKNCAKRLRQKGLEPTAKQHDMLCIAYAKRQLANAQYGLDKAAIERDLEQAERDILFYAGFEEAARLDAEQGICDWARLVESPFYAFAWARTMQMRCADPAQVKVNEHFELAKAEPVSWASRGVDWGATGGF